MHGEPSRRPADTRDFGQRGFGVSSVAFWLKDSETQLKMPKYQGTRLWVGQILLLGDPVDPVVANATANGGVSPPVLRPSAGSQRFPADRTQGKEDGQQKNGGQCRQTGGLTPAVRRILLQRLGRVSLPLVLVACPLVAAEFWLVAVWPDAECSLESTGWPNDFGEHVP